MPGAIIGRIPKGKSDEVRISLESYKGQDLIDVRLFMRLSDPSGEIIATKKGVSLPIDCLPDLAGAIQKAMEEAQRRGLLKAS